MGSKAERLCRIDRPTDGPTDRMVADMRDSAASAHEAAMAMTELGAAIEMVYKSLPNAMELLRDS